jgi:hypothetical protein
MYRTAETLELSIVYRMIGAHGGTDLSNHPQHDPIVDLFCGVGDGKSRRIDAEVLQVLQYAALWRRNKWYYRFTQSITLTLFIRAHDSSDDDKSLQYSSAIGTMTRLVNTVGYTQ